MYRELASRRENGILVRLLWDVVGDAILLRYRDERTGDTFAARVPNAKALEAFRHPNLYRESLAPA